MRLNSKKQQLQSIIFRFSFNNLLNSVSNFSEGSKPNLANTSEVYSNPWE